MTTLILSAATQVGGAIGGTFFGPAGEALGNIAGRYAGRALNQRLFAKPTKRRTVYGAHLKDMNVQASTEGAPVPRVYGRARVSGQVIWATQFEELVSSSTSSSKPRGGGKGTKPPASKTTTVSYSYYANFAVALCEGEVAHLGRVWADGKLLDSTALTMRFYNGDEAQVPDPLIAAKQGAGCAPAYRGVAYVVFEHLALAPFGNRIPQLQFEIIRPVGALEDKIRAMTIIPGATEFGYDTVPVVRVLGVGHTVPENNHAPNAPTNFEASIEELLAICPNLERVSLVVPWFGDDMRAGDCTIRPKVENYIKQTSGAVWSVAGLGRGDAQLVSTSGGVSAYGGTPNDMSVIRCIQYLKALGLQVTLYPFVLMDIAAGNSLPDPYTGGTGQAAYPWRGRVTCSPAIGAGGTVDGTATAATQISAFFGTALASHFAVSGTNVSYSGPNEWSFRRHILHSAAIAKAAGGVDGFIIGSELIGLTRVRGTANSFPTVDGLKSLAGQVRALMGAGCKLTYAADWTEYGAYARSNGDVFFPLDALWADSNIDAVGIDFYAPLTDWRAGVAHLDAGIAQCASDPAYLQQNVAGGEAYDWYYVNDAARTSQTRTAITDGAYSKPWMFRQKDLKGWWSNAHYGRSAGVQNGSPTAWLAQSKPIWLVEIGCAAVDMGTNEPSAFPDGKSVDGHLPRGSVGMRDDHTQRRALEAFYEFYAVAGNNPTSSVYGGAMLDVGQMYPWAWDARPFPYFPSLQSEWADGDNWHTGHWLNGRLGGLPMDGLVTQVLADYGVDVEIDVARLQGFADGLAVDRPSSARDVLEGAAQLQQFRMAERADALAFYSRGQSAPVILPQGDVVAIKKQPMRVFVQGDARDVPTMVSVSCTDVTQDFGRVAVSARKSDADAGDVLHMETAMSLTQDRAEHLVNQRLGDLWNARAQVKCAVPLRYLALEPGDCVTFDDDATGQLYELQSVELSTMLNLEGQSLDMAVFAPSKRARAVTPAQVLPTGAGAEVWLFEVPAAAAGDGASGVTLAIAGFARPWQRLAIYRMIGDEAQFVGALEQAATMGNLSSALNATHVIWRRDVNASTSVALFGGALASITLMRLLSGGNAMALVDGVRGAEFLQFQNAILAAPNTYTLNTILRGQLGTDTQAATIWPAGTQCVMMDDAVLYLSIAPDDVEDVLTFKIGPADRAYDDASFVTKTVQLNGRYVKPIAPLHVEGVRASDGVHIQFKRRVRGGGDSWNVAEVPLEGVVERYTLEIMSGVIVKRSVTLTSPDYVYANADELTDFGAAQSSLSVRVAQVSSVYGAGDVSSQVINL